MKKITSKIARVILLCLGSLAGLVAISSVANSVLTGMERSDDKDPGTLVNVSGKSIHLSTAGNGPTKVILLSGLG